jgi:lysozyme
MSTAEKTLEADILGQEKAIRLITGERKALGSRLAREHALLKLSEARLKVLERPKPLPSVNLIPHGDRFFDVSNNQPHVDFMVAAKAGSVRVGTLAVTKLTEGTAFTDAYGVERLNEMKTAGFFHRGAYCFGHPSEGGTAQAEYFMNAGGHLLTAADIAVYDCEVTDGQTPAAVASAARDFGQYVRAHSQAKLWLYGGGPFLHENGVTLAGFDAHWLAAYVPDPSEFMVYGRGRTVAWQFSDGVHGPTPHLIPGVGAVDVSIIL